MDQAMVAGLWAVGGAAVGAAGGYFGPLQLQRRAHVQERATLTDQALQEALELTAEVRTAGAMWEHDMLGALRNLKAGRAVELADFDAAMRGHTQQIRESMSRLVRYGLHVSSATMQRLFTPMREAEDQMRAAIADPVGSEDALRVGIYGAVRAVWGIRHELDHDIVEELSVSMGLVITGPSWRNRRRLGTR
ncbi:hypothetical protein TPA0910_30460 [Streptomyces hygroscopicus subsp. sporocinereus]|uniref:Uncharacterized protein n=1 Tax=Streptomyces hygroscopicus TaxID=1912 RepID=A0ABQ3U081_STRHY|nr:hypothetical protein TPA0910_30460 [Streptomyces hygroscopicus]